MRTLLLVLGLGACAPDAATIAEHRLAGAMCDEGQGDGIALCSYKDRNYICYTSYDMHYEKAFCIEAKDAVDLVGMPYTWQKDLHHVGE